MRAETQYSKRFILFIMDCSHMWSGKFSKKLCGKGTRPLCQFANDIFIVVQIW